MLLQTETAHPNPAVKPPAFVLPDARELTNAIPIGLAIVDQTGKFLFANRELEQMTGYPEGTLQGQQVEILLPSQLRNRHAEEREAYAQAPSIRRMGAGRELFARRIDGTEFPVEVGLRPMQVGEGTAILASVIDLSERRRLEAGFRAVIEAAPCGMLLTGADGTITLTNQRLNAMFGYTEAELRGQPVEILIPHRKRRGHVELRNSYNTAPSERAMGNGMDLTGRRRDGVEIPVEVALSTVNTTEGRMTLAVVVDITKRQRTEMRLREANAQLEEFAYVSSHDLRSPIRGLGNLVEFIREDFGESAPKSTLRNLDRMQERIRRMEQLIEDLLVYARAGQRSSQIGPIDLSEVIDDLLKLDPPPAGISVELDLEAQPFEGVKTPLATALRNLFSNACKHHDRPEGRIVIRSREEGGYCVIEIADDGPGIPEHAQERIFRLFQTLTSSQRQSSGLGLAVTKRLVEGHGGRIDVKSRDGERGSTFRVCWPRFVRSDLDD